MEYWGSSRDRWYFLTRQKNCNLHSNSISQWFVNCKQSSWSNSRKGCSRWWKWEGRGWAMWLSRTLSPGPFSYPTHPCWSVILLMCYCLCHRVCHQLCRHLGHIGPSAHIKSWSVRVIQCVIKHAFDMIGNCWCKQKTRNSLSLYSYNEIPKSVL